MRRIRRLRRGIAGLVASLLFATLHPAVAALWPTGPDARVEVCSALGKRWVASADASPEDGQVGGSPHCPLCRPADDTPALGARGDLAFARPASLARLPAFAPRGHAAARPWRHDATPRAPPGAT